MYVKDSDTRVAITGNQGIDEMRMEYLVRAPAVRDREQPADDAGNPLPRRTQAVTVHGGQLGTRNW